LWTEIAALLPSQRFAWRGLDQRSNCVGCDGVNTAQGSLQSIICLKIAFQIAPSIGLVRQIYVENFHGLHRCLAWVIRRESCERPDPQPLM
jgi:hypothetical protein